MVIDQVSSKPPLRLFSFESSLLPQPWGSVLLLTCGYIPCVNRSVKFSTYETVLPTVCPPLKESSESSPVGGMSCVYKFLSSKAALSLLFR